MEQTTLLDADTILAIAAVITAIAGLVKAWQSGKDLKTLTAKVAALETENKTLRERLELALKENDELRDQNKALTAINEDYRTRLLTALEHKPSQTRKS